MTPRGTTGETAGTCSANHLAPAPPHRYRPRDLDPGERAQCVVCGKPNHHIPPPRAAKEETK